MISRCTVRPGDYYDSVVLMELARALLHLPGVVDAAVVMATAANKDVLRQAGLLLPEIAAAGANDLAIALRAESEAEAEDALHVAAERLARRPAAGGKEAPGRTPRTIRAALRRQPQANLALISVPGQYAADEAWAALRHGLHVFLFSDHVSVADEVALKIDAAGRGLLLMGPGCGTAILDGVALGFANAVPRGPVGIVAAAGTGLQEVSALLTQLGVGVSQGIGAGGRDLQEAIGGLTMQQGIARLQADPQTEVLLLLSKPPSPVVAERMLALVRAGGKPAVVCFLGGDPAPVAAAGAIPAHTLQEAAMLAAEAAGYEGPPANAALELEAAALAEQAASLRGLLRSGQRYLRGLFSGGTLAAEALAVWSAMGLAVRSNVAADPRFKMADAACSEGHCAVDLGEDEFTLGCPHPMIDNDLRIRRLLQEAAEPDVAVVLLDVVLGYGAHPDPAAELGPAIRRARALAATGGRELIVVASVTGTEDDPQGLTRQTQALEEAGAIVCSCNAAAARLAGLVVGHRDQGAREQGDKGTRGRGEVPSSPCLLVPLSAVRVINIGLSTFAESLEAQGVEVVRVDWRPPLAPRLLFTAQGVDVEAANAEAVRRIAAGHPKLVGMGIAGEVIPGYHERLILHSGPPVAWKRMCGPQRGAVMGALVYEGLAKDEAEAARMAAEGAVEFAPCHHYHAVGPMAGIISPSMPVFVVRNETFGNQAYATQNEGLGRVLRYGAFG
ncbi:MAG: acyl-CoA synthetase FdrA, partial [Anaerolineae bacterium]|nr:acyl-CoA synthetase FdrA [Anaerolineae bacterium]